MTKPLPEMSVADMETALAEWLDGDIVKAEGEIVDPFDIFDELSRRNKRLVEALRSVDAGSPQYDIVREALRAWLEGKQLDERCKNV